MVGDRHSGTPYDSPGTLGKPMFVLQDRYEVINHLGEGGMGTVYVARDRRLGRRQCVVKKLRDDFFRLEDKEKAMAFFEREVLVLSQLQHSNIVHILDSFKENDDCYLVMEYVEGENLHQMLHRRGDPFPEEQVLEWVAQIAEVLDYLHTNDPQIIYRDLKPSNIMIDTKDRVKLVDFGIARPYVEEADNTHVVSAGYSPPEQYWGAADPRSDIYALGATMYFLLTGEEPLALQTSCPRRVNPGVSDHTDMIVQRATAQDLLLRYQSAIEMKEDLEQWKFGTEQKGSANKTALTAVVSILVVLVSAIIYSTLANNANTVATSQLGEKVANARIERLQRENKELERNARMQQANLIETVSPKGNLLQKSDTTKHKATVAFREVDESQLSDPQADPIGNDSQSNAMPPKAPDRHHAHHNANNRLTAQTSEPQHSQAGDVTDAPYQTSNPDDQFSQQPEQQQQ